MARSQESNYNENLAKEARDLSDKIAKRERMLDRSVLLLREMVNITSGNFPERVKAINFLAEIGML